MAPDPPVVRARGLTRRYETLVAVDGIDFEILPGTCVGFLGPNGAGKTTTVRMTAGFTPITAGRVEVFGIDVARDPRAVKRRLGICPQEDNLDPDFSVERNLRVFARYFDIPPAEAARRTDALLAMMQLEEKRRSSIGALSGGMKRRLVLARALVNEPDLLLLDEPTTGLDPQARHMIWQRVRSLKERGTTILLTTHYMEEAATLCDRVILMDRGRILLEGTPNALIATEVGQEVLEIRRHDEAVLDFVRSRGWDHEVHDDRLFVYLPPGSEGGRAFSDRFPHQERLLRPASLEDVFLRRAGRALRD